LLGEFALPPAPMTLRQNVSIFMHPTPSPSPPVRDNLATGTAFLFN